MKQTLALLLVTLTVLPSHAAARNCRLAPRVNRARVAVDSVAGNHAHANFVITAFAVPVAVPVAPFAPYWYGISEYAHQATSSFPRSARERTAGEAPPRATSIIHRHCTSCHGSVSPKQGVSLVDARSMSAENRIRAIRAVVTGAMPPDTEPKLSDADREAIIRELLGETDENANDE